MVYITKSLHVISAAQKNTKVLPFEPIVAGTTQRISGCSNEANDTIQFNVDGSQGDREYAITFFKNIHPTLAPGEALNAMIRIMIYNIAKSGDTSAAKYPHRITLGL
jgi:hypothetical protein